MTPMSKLFTACVMSLTVGGEVAAYAATLPQLPQAQVDVTMPTVTGSTLNATCATFQTQINAAAALSVNLTHQVILATDTTCTGPYKLPSHTGGTGWILIKGANYASLPQSGTRVAPSDATLMPHIIYGDDGVANTGAFSAQTGAQRYRIMGFYMTEDVTRSPNWSFINTGYNNANATNTGYIIIDRVIIRDLTDVHASYRGVFLEGQLGNLAVLDSWIDGIKDIGRVADTQAILTISSGGPILIQNNFVEAAGENIMIGGGDPVDTSVQPRDSTIRLNTFSKNSAWVSGGTHLIKTMLELKSGFRTLVEGNDFLNMPWDDGGATFRLTVRNSGGPGTYVDVSDITIRYNLGKNVTNWINAFGSDDQPAFHSMHSKRWHIHNNLIYGLGWVCGGGASCGRFFQIQAGGSICTDPTPSCKNQDVTIAHNTVDDVVEAMFYKDDGSIGASGLDFRDNLINVNGGRGAYSMSAWGTNVLNAIWSSTWTWTNNRLAGIGGGEDTGQYPQGTNSYPSSYTNFLWTNRAARDYTLQAGSPAKGAASDGTDQGVNFSAYNAARAGRSVGGVVAALVPPAAPQNVVITR